MRYLGGKASIASKIAPAINQFIHKDSIYVEPFCGSLSITEKIKPCKQITAYCGFYISLMGIWFNGLCKPCSKLRRNGSIWTYDGEAAAYNDYLKKRAWFKKNNNVEIHNKSYSDLVIEDGSIVYCDPPYFNTANPGNVSRVFDHVEFWKWADELSNRCIVIVSEYVCKSSVQDQWECIFEMDRGLRIPFFGNGDAKKVTEKVFMRGWLR